MNGLQLLAWSLGVLLVIANWWHEGRPSDNRDNPESNYPE